MDNGEVIPNLDKPWEFMMARLHEWLAGMILAIICNEIFFTSATSAMPLLFAIMVISTYSFACARLKFADGTKGCVNWCCVKMGIVPQGIPAPSELQPVWSGAPIRRINEKTLYMQLGFDEFFEKKKEEKSKKMEEGRL